MDLGQVIALSSIVVGIGVLALIVGGAWALGRQHELRLRANQTGTGVPDTAELEARLRRIERMLEMLSTDVERIADERRPPTLPRM